MMRYGLFLVLVVGFLLRLWGVDYGLPFPLVSDEEVLIGGALKMLELRSLIPALHPEAMSILYYPVALPYLYIVLMTPVFGGLYLLHGLPSLDQFALVVLDNMSPIWLAARLSSVVMSTATLFLIYRLGAMLLRSPLAGAVAATLMAFDYMHVMLGHVARHWSATVFLIWAVAWLSSRYYEQPSLRKAAAIGLLAGTGFGVSYIGALGFGFGGVAHYLAWKKKSVPLLGQNMLIMAGACAILSTMFIVLYPQPILRLGTILPVAQPKTTSGWWSATIFYTRGIWLSNPALLVMGGIGLIAATLTRRWFLLAGSLFLILFYTVFLYRAMPLEDRYILPLSPVLAFLGGFAVNEAWGRRPGSQRLRRAFLASGMVLLVGYSAAISFRASYLLAQTDTRLLAKTWLENNLPAGERIAMNTNVVRLTPNLQSLVAQKELDPSSLKAVDRLRLARQASDSPEARNVLNLWQLSPEGLKKVDNAAFAKQLRLQGYHYYVADKFGEAQTPTLHQAMLRGAHEVAHFSPGDETYPPPTLRTTILVPYAMYHLFSAKRFGPEVVVLRLPNTPEESTPLQGR